MRKSLSNSGIRMSLKFTTDFSKSYPDNFWKNLREISYFGKNYFEKDDILITITFFTRNDLKLRTRAIVAVVEMDTELSFINDDDSNVTAWLSKSSW